MGFTEKTNLLKKLTTLWWMSSKQNQPKLKTKWSLLQNDTWMRKLYHKYSKNMPLQEMNWILSISDKPWKLLLAKCTFLPENQLKSNQKTWKEERSPIKRYLQKEPQKAWNRIISKVYSTFSKLTVLKT